MASEFIYTPSLVARGDLYVGRFVMADPTYDKGALQATAGMRTLGVTGPGQHDPPGLSGATHGLIARAGQSFKFFGPGAAEVPLEAGTSGYARFDFLKADADGKAVKAQPGDTAGAIALTSVAAGGMGIVWVIEPKEVPDFGGATPELIAATPLTLTAADSGKTFYTTIADVVFNLPATAAGLSFTVVTGVASAGTGTALSPVAADLIEGAGVTPADNKDLINTGATDAVGDSVTVYGNGTTGWLAVVNKGTWAREA